MNNLNNLQNNLNTSGNFTECDIPWQALRTLIGESIYGGRIDNAFDSALLRNLVAHLFVPQCFDADFALATACVPDDATGTLQAVSVVKIPDGSDKEHFMQWVKQLPISNPPSWLGLSRNAETLMLRNGGASPAIARHRACRHLPSAVLRSPPSLTPPCTLAAPRCSSRSQVCGSCACWPRCRTARTATRR